MLHGSFAKTAKGHGTELALVAGLCGAFPDDPRIPDAFELAYADPSHRPSDVDHCTIGGSIDGKYVSR